MYTLELDGKEVAQATAVSGLDGGVGGKVVIRVADLSSVRFLSSWLAERPGQASQITFLKDGAALGTLWLKPDREDTSANLVALEITAPA
jgi:hypothetical protein